MPVLDLINQFLSTPLLDVGTERITLIWFLKLILALASILLFTNLCKQFLRDYVLARLKFSQGSREAISTLVSYCLGVLGFFIVLSVNGLNIASLAVVLGGLGVGIGFGLQDLTRNLVSGLTLLFEGKLQVGDYVEFSHLSGYIKEISMRSTVIKTFDGGDVVVPNSSLVSHEVLNWSYKDYSGKIRLMIGVSYSSDPVLVTEVLLNSAYMEPTVLYDPPPKVIFKGFGDSSLEFELWVWVKRIDEGISARSSLNYIIDYNFREAGIQIPFPQRELWMRSRKERVPQPVGNDAPIEYRGSAINLESPQPIFIRDLLRQVPYFQYASDLHLRGVIEVGYRKALSAGDILFQEGEPGTAVYIVISGEIELRSIRLNRQLRVHHAGDFFGEQAILLGLMHIATAQAIAETDLFVIPKPNFERLLNTCPKLADTFSQELAKAEPEYTRLRQQLEDLGILGMAEQHPSFVSWVQHRLEQLFRIPNHGEV